MIANVVFGPGPDFHSGVAAVAAWGACLAAAAALGGWSWLLDPHSRWRTRLRLVAVLLVVAACGISARNPVQERRGGAEAPRRDHDAINSRPTSPAP